MLLDEAVNGGLKIDDGAEDPVLQASARQLCEEALDGVHQEHDVGTKWKVQRRCRASQARTFGCLWVA